MAMKTYFVYDKETGYILSGFDCCSDNHNDGMNVFSRPYKCTDLHPKNEKCKLDYLYNESKRKGLNSLKYENMVVSEADFPYNVKCHFVENPNYLYDKNATKGWWKLDS
jgi:hypothetical protein